MMDIVETYLSKIEEIVGKIREEEKDKLIHVFGTGGHPKSPSQIRNQAPVLI